MARELYEIEKGLKIVDIDGSDGIVLLQGTAAPDGVGTDNDQSDAELSSLYFRRGTSEIYKKVLDNGNAADWELINTSASVGNFRGEKVVALTGDSVTAGVARDMALNPFSDDEGTQLGASDFQVGEFIIANNVLLEVTDVSGDDVTFSTPGSAPALSQDDTFIVRHYLPDSPGDQEGQALALYDGAAMIKIADIDWNFADGISIKAGFASSAGSAAAISGSDTVQSALEKVESQNKAQDSVLGTALGDTDLGTFSGNIISDNGSVKAGMQELELATEEIDQNVDDLITLSGMPENSTDLGTFPGAVISDSVDVKTALTELEAKDEAQDLVITEIDGNVDDLITLSGVPENSTNLGAFSGFGGILLTATETVKSAIQKITDFLGNLRSVEVTSVTTQAVVDSVPVASVYACKWFVTAFEEATPANREAFEVYALTDGTIAKENVTSKLRVGANFNLVIDTDVNGGNMRLLATSSTAGVTVRARRVAVEDV